MQECPIHHWPLYLPQSRLARHFQGRSAFFPWPAGAAVPRNDHVFSSNGLAHKEEVGVPGAGEHRFVEKSFTDTRMSGFTMW